MVTATLPNGISYTIPKADMMFFTQLAERMKWKVTSLVTKPTAMSSKGSWTNDFAGKWQDSRSAEQIVRDIHSARTLNDEISL